jgi:hypothetical protein
MAPKNPVDERFREVQNLRHEADSKILRKKISSALQDRSNLVVSEAAKIIREFELTGFESELLASWERLLTNPAKLDPGCTAKTAIIEALGQFDFDDPEFYAKAILYQQPEPVWGGTDDTAVNVRGASAFAIARSRRMNIVAKLTTLVELLLDPENARSRVFAAQAIADTRRDEAIPVLRLQLGSSNHAETMGACMTGLLTLAPDTYVPLVATYLEAEREEIILEAAASLGTCGRREAVAVLISAWKRTADPELKVSLLMSIGLSKESSGFDFLISLIAENTRDSEIALDALKPLCVYPDLCQRVRAGVTQSQSRVLLQVFERRYGKRDTQP